jgi:hypothetical protein
LLLPGKNPSHRQLDSALGNAKIPDEIDLDKIFTYCYKSDNDPRPVYIPARSQAKISQILTSAHPGQKDRGRGRSGSMPSGHSHEGDVGQHLPPHYLKFIVKPTHEEFFEESLSEEQRASRPFVWRQHLIIGLGVEDHKF